MSRSDNPFTSLLLAVGAACACFAVACGGSTPPEPARVDPPRRKVLLEIDRMKDTPAIELEQTVNGTKVSLQSIYAAAGIELDVRQDQVDLPRQDEVGLPDLHAMMAAFRSISAPDGVMRVHALVLTRLRDEPDALGAMFDVGEQDLDSRPREGFAIFADRHASLEGGLQPELLLTLAHELAHCFNLHHPDWEGKGFRSDGTIESYSPANSVRWTLSDHSKSHIRDDPGREVWPGRSNIGFNLVTAGHLARHQPLPREGFEVMDPASFSERRPAASVRRAAARLAERDRSGFLAADQEPVKLRLEAPKASYVAGEPVVLAVGLHNAGQSNQLVLPLLDPRYRFLIVEISGPGRTDFEVFQPLVLADARGTQPQLLAPGASVHAEARVFFDARGWVFEQPGTYSIRADFEAPTAEGQPPRADKRLQSNLLEITITEPATTADRRVSALLDKQEGLYLLLGGGDHLTRAAANLKKAVQDSPQAAQAAAVRLALGTAALNPTVDPSTGVQSEPRLDEAKKLLGTTFGSQLPALSVVKAQTELAETLEEKGRSAEGARVRTETVQKMRRYESAREYIDDFTKPSPPPTKSAKPPGERRQ